MHPGFVSSFVATLATSAALLVLPVSMALLACGSSDEPAPPDNAPRATVAEAPADAAPAPATTEPLPPEPHNTSPDPDFHLDPDPEPTRRVTANHRSRSRPIEFILRSTPPGATASVDGRPIGTTPTYWAGETDGRPRDVTFALPGYAVARYRFVATRSGVVHGRLRRLSKAEPDRDTDGRAAP